MIELAGVLLAYLSLASQGREREKAAIERLAVIEAKLDLLMEGRELVKVRMK